MLRLYKNVCRHKHIEFWKNEKIKIDNKNNKFWDTWKNLGEEYNQEQYLNANGDEWETYFRNLYKSHVESSNVKLENINEKENNNFLNKPFTMKELKQTIKKMKKCKASGYDNINIEFIKLSTERILTVILSFLNLTLREGLITSNWCLDIITPIHKEGKNLI